MPVPRLTRTLLPPLLAACLLPAAGCANRFTDALPYWPWETERTAFLTPNKRIERLRGLREQAASKSAAEQDLIAGELLLEIQKEEDPLMREEIVQTLGHCNGKTAQTVLRAALKDADPGVRVRACEILAEQGGSDVSSALAEALQSDTDVDVRMAAARGLRKYKDPATVPALGVALDDPDPALQYRAIQSLREATGKNLGDDVSVWRAYVRGERPAGEPSLADRVREFRPF